METVTTKLGFLKYGDPKGTPLALIHGWGCDSRYLLPVADMFKERDVYLIDLPGYGRSAHLKKHSASVEETAHLLHQTLPQKCDVIAWSMGGHFALSCASLQPQKIRTLVTICTNPRFLQDPTWPGMSSDLILKCRQMLNPRRCNRLLHFFIKYQIAANQNRRGESDFLSSLRKSSEDIDFEVLMNGIQTMSFSDVRACLTHLKIPVLLLFGAKDVLVPASLSHILCKGDDELKESFVFADSAHLPYLTEPEIFEKAVRNFYEKVDDFYARAPD